MVPGKEALRLIGDLEQFHLNRARISSVESTMMKRWRARWPEVPVAVWEILGSGLEMVDLEAKLKQDFHKVLPWFVAVGQRSRERSLQMQVANDVASAKELPSCEARPGRRVNNSAAGKLQGGELREDCVEGALERGLAG